MTPPTDRRTDPQRIALHQLAADRDLDADRLRELVGLLELTDEYDPAKDAHRDARINATAARCIADGSHVAARVGIDGHTQHRLTSEDADAVDAAFEPHQAGRSASNPARNRRPRRVASLLSLLETDAPTPAERESLLTKTLAAIDADAEREGDRLRLAPPNADDLIRAPGRRRLADVVALAAMIILGVSVFSTVSSHVRSNASLRTNEANLAQAGFGMGLYSADHDLRLPATPDRADRPDWWSVGDRFNSHSANLFTLADRGYTPLASLASPTNRFAPTSITDDFDGDWRSSPEVSYSYQLFLTPPRMSDPRLRILLGDRSPIAQHAAEGLRVNPLANSRAHRGAGQHVLTRGRAVLFIDSPVIDRGDGTADNIWLPRPSEGAIPSARDIRRPNSPAADVFLAP